MQYPGALPDSQLIGHRLEGRGHVMQMSYFSGVIDGFERKLAG
jgi:hypothetical protein